MTPTAIELWNDKKFIEKRIKEQGEYLVRLGIDHEKRPLYRINELAGHARFILDRFEARLKELNSALV